MARQPVTVRTRRDLLRLPASLFAELQTIASAEKNSIAAVVRRLLSAAVAAERRQRDGR